jgi:hypothetical protein
MGIEPTNLLHAMQALYQLSYAPGAALEPSRAGAGSSHAASPHLRTGNSLAGRPPASRQSRFYALTAAS